MFRHEMTHTRTSSLPFFVGNLPPSTSEAMLQTLLVAQLNRNITAWSKMIGQDRAKAKNSVETFKNLGRHTN